jgi:DNA polymerase/3'-5' exonuclease PolX
MSSDMNSRSITDYILKLEKLNEESRAKIEQLKKLFLKENSDKVDALNALNDFKYKTNCMSKPSYTESTARVCGKTPYCKTRENAGIVERLLELGEMTSDFHKTAAYQGAADTIADLDYVIESGECVRHLRGIGRGISSKIDEYLDEQDSDYEESECSDTESIASTESYIETIPNQGIADMLYAHAEKTEDKYKYKAYIKAADMVYNLNCTITSGAEAMKLPGIGKSIGKKIDAFLDDEDDDFHVKFHTNVIISDELSNLATLEEHVGASEWKVNAYKNAAKLIDTLPYEVLNGTDLTKFDGIGKGIAQKVDEIIQFGSTRRAHELKQANPDKCN